MDNYLKAIELIRASNSIVAFSGAGISVESGIPTFRGDGGLWSRYDPKILDLDFFFQNPKASWKAIREIFYNYMGERAKPNSSHKFLAKLEEIGKLKGVITQNIDNLHQEAGSKRVIEFHGTAQKLLCTKCRKKFDFREYDLNSLPPLCRECKGLLKPDFIFFKEQIPPFAYQESLKLLQNANLVLIIGTTGEVMPASMLPYEAKGAKFIKINIEPSSYTNSLTDIFLQDRATIASKKLAKGLGIDLK